MSEELLFYDLEVFEYDSLAMFLDIDGNEVGRFWNTRGRKDVLAEPSGFEGIAGLIEGKTLVGYNNYAYDDIILTKMMNPVIPQELIFAANNSIIRGTGGGGKPSPLIRSLDTMQQISVSHPSLKQIEGNMGRSIVETSVAFDIGRPLTDSEREETEFYCRNDILNTIEVYKLRERSYFETKKSLLTMLQGTNPDKAYRWNTTTLSTNILLGHEKLPYWNKIRIPDGIFKNPDLGIPEEVWHFWETRTTEENILSKGKTLTVREFDCDITFGLGGLHGAPKKPIRYDREDIKLADVGSMYPSLICMLDVLGGATDLYDSIRKTRLEIKHSDKTRADALKLVLNSVYGLLKSKYSALFNPMASATICIYGQIALHTLCKALYEAGYKIVNANTDGVAFINRPELGDVYEGICRKWEEQFKGLVLEIDEFTTWIQKDVSNYIAIFKGGKVKVKGSETNKYHDNNYFNNNDCRIVQMAMVDYLLHGTDPLDTIENHLDEPLLYQYVLKAGSTYLGVKDAAGQWQNKVNRVYATYSSNEKATKLYKIREDGGQVNFPDAPEYMYLWNEDVNGIKDDFRNIINREHYYNIIVKKLKGWGVDVC